MFGRPFAHHELDEHINVKEAIAVHDALSILSWPADVAAKLLVDKTSVLYCVAKGTSKGFALNEAIGRIKPVLNGRRSSQCNISSRGKILRIGSRAFSNEID